MLLLRKPVCALSFILAIIIQASPSHAEPDDSGQNNHVFHDQLDTISKQVIGDLLAAPLSEHEKEVINSVKFEIVDDDNELGSPEALTDTQEGDHKVRFGTGFYRAIYMFGEVCVIQLKTGKTDSVRRYLNYVVTRLAENSLVSAEDQKPIDDPYRFFHINLETAEEWQQEPNSIQLMAGITLSATAFVIAHEYGHWIHNDPLHPFVSLQDSRRREAAADAWACKALLKAGYMPLGGFYADSIFYFEDQDAIHHEEKRTHPAEIRRIQMVLKATLDNLDLFADRAEQSGQSLDSIRDQLKRAESQIEREITTEESGKSANQ
jgi:hypothetical protein